MCERGIRIGACLPRSLVEPLNKELLAFRLAPSSTPTPSRSTSSLPNQPVTRDRPAPAKERIYASVPGSSGASQRSSQLPINNSKTITLTSCATTSVLMGTTSRSTRGSTSRDSRESAVVDPNWLNVKRLAQVEITSEDPEHTIRSSSARSGEAARARQACWCGSASSTST
jgi:hypothetical protein